jgi:hypothetical protein
MDAAQAELLNLEKSFRTRTLQIKTKDQEELLQGIRPTDMSRHE